jgi:hypothetical protein
MRVKPKLKKSNLNKKLFANLKNLEGSLKAGYPAENPQTHEKDLNGYSALEKAHALNFSDKNFKPYLQISFVKNKIKYQKKFILIARSHPRKQNSQLEILGKEMVKDIKASLAQLQSSPISLSKGCIYGSISYIKVSK